MNGNLAINAVDAVLDRLLIFDSIGILLDKSFHFVNGPEMNQNGVINGIRSEN